MHNRKEQKKIDVSSNQYFSKSKQNSDFFFQLFGEDGDMKMVKLFNCLWPKQQEIYCDKGKIMIWFCLSPALLPTHSQLPSAFINLSFLDIYVK